MLFTSKFVLFCLTFGAGIISRPVTDNKVDISPRHLTSCDEIFEAYPKCPNANFAQWEYSNLPKSQISITNVESVGGNSYEVTVHFKSDHTMSLSSLSELKIMTPVNTFIFSRNGNVKLITNPGDFTYTFTVGAIDSIDGTRGELCIPAVSFQFDWCSVGVDDKTECNSWRYDKSYDIYTGCQDPIHKSGSLYCFRKKECTSSSSVASSSSLTTSSCSTTSSTSSSSSSLTTSSCSTTSSTSSSSSSLTTSSCSTTSSNSVASSSSLTTSSCSTTPSSSVVSSSSLTTSSCSTTSSSSVASSSSLTTSSCSTTSSNSVASSSSLTTSSCSTTSSNSVASSSSLTTSSCSTTPSSSVVSSSSLTTSSSSTTSSCSTTSSSSSSLTTSSCSTTSSSSVASYSSLTTSSCSTTSSSSVASSSSFTTSSCSTTSSSSLTTSSCSTTSSNSVASSSSLTTSLCSTTPSTSVALSSSVVSPISVVTSSCSTMLSASVGSPIIPSSSVLTSSSSTASSIPTSQLSSPPSETASATSSIFVTTSTTTLKTISSGQSIAIQTCETTVTTNSNGDCITITSTIIGTSPLFPSASGTSESSMGSPTLTSLNVQPGSVVGNTLASQNPAMNIHSSSEEEHAKTVASVSIITNEDLTYTAHHPLPTSSKGSTLINGTPAPKSSELPSPNVYSSIDTDYSLMTPGSSATFQFSNRPSVAATFNQGSHNFKTVSSAPVPSPIVSTFSTAPESSAFTYVSVYSGHAAFSKKRSSLLWTFLLAIAYI